MHTLEDHKKIIKFTGYLEALRSNGKLSKVNEENLLSNIHKMAERPGNAHIILMCHHKFPDLIKMSDVVEYIVKDLMKKPDNAHIVMACQKECPDRVHIKEISEYLINEMKDSPVMAKEVSKMIGKDDVWILTNAYTARMSQGASPKDSIYWAENLFSNVEVLPSVVQNRISDSWSRFMTRAHIQSNTAIKGTQASFTEEEANAFGVALNWATAGRINAPDNIDSLVMAAHHYMKTQAINETLPIISGMQDNMLRMVWSNCLADPGSNHKQRRAELITLEDLRFTHNAENWVKTNVGPDKAGKVLEMWHKSAEAIDQYLNPGSLSREAGMDVAMQINDSLRSKNQVSSSESQMSLSLS